MKETRIINLTPHDIVFTSGKVLHASGTIARCAVTSIPVGVIGGIPVVRMRAGEVYLQTEGYAEPRIGLPDEQEGVYYITSRVVAETVRRRDVLCPGKCYKVFRPDGTVSMTTNDLASIC